MISVASIAHTAGNVDPADLNFEKCKYNARTAYGASKSANILSAKSLADRLAAADSKVLSVSLHLGLIKTPLWKHNKRFVNWMADKLLMDKDVPLGAVTSIYAALAPRDALPPGAYLADCAVSSGNNPRNKALNKQCTNEDKTVRNALCSSTEKLIKGARFKLPASLFSK